MEPRHLRMSNPWEGAQPLGSHTIWKTTLLCSLSQVRKTTRSSGATKSTVLSTSARKHKHTGPFNEEASSTQPNPWKKTQQKYHFAEEKGMLEVTILQRNRCAHGAFWGAGDSLVPDLGDGSYSWFLYSYLLYRVLVFYALPWCSVYIL